MGFPYTDDDLYDFDWDPNIDVMVLDFINDMLIDSTTENIYKLKEYSRLNLNLRNMLKDSETSIYDIFNNIFYQMKKHFEDEESNGSSEFSYTIEKI
jgi:hemerythrin